MPLTCLKVSKLLAAQHVFTGPIVSLAELKRSICLLFCLKVTVDLSCESVFLTGMYDFEIKLDEGNEEFEVFIGKNPMRTIHTL